MKSTDFKATIKNMSPDIYASFKRAVELGKWPNGQRLKPEQTDLCLQTMIAWEQYHKPEEERTGYMAQTCKSGVAEKTSKSDAEKETASILRFEI